MSGRPFVSRGEEPHSRLAASSRGWQTGLVLGFWCLVVVLVGLRLAYRERFPQAAALQERIITNCTQPQGCVRGSR